MLTRQADVRPPGLDYGRSFETTFRPHQVAHTAILVDGYFSWRIWEEGGPVASAEPLRSGCRKTKDERSRPAGPVFRCLARVVPIGESCRWSGPLAQCFKKDDAGGDADIE